MRCCCLLALGLVLGWNRIQSAMADEPPAGQVRNTLRAKAEGEDGTQATLSALSAAVKIPAARRRASKSAPISDGKSEPVVRLAVPYTAPQPTGDEKSLGGLATRLVSHSEAVSEPIVTVSDESPELNRSAVQTASAWKPADVGDLEEELKTPAVSPKTSSRRNSPEPAAKDNGANPLRQAVGNSINSPGLINPLR
jgi:hypothetical protein